MKLDLPKLLAGLPDDDADAMAEILARLAQIRQQPESDFDPAVGCKLLQRLSKEILDLELTTSPSNSWEEDYDGFLRTLNLQIADAVISRDVGTYVKGRRGLQNGYGYVGLDAAEKKHIRDLVKRIKEKIDASTIHERKKNAIRQRLLQLEREIESSGTAIDNAMGLLFDITFAVRGGHKNLDGVISDAKDITKILVERRASDEKVALPPADADGMISLPPPEPEAPE